MWRGDSAIFHGPFTPHSPKTLVNIFCLFKSRLSHSPTLTYSCDLASYSTEKIGLKEGIFWKHLLPCPPAFLRLGLFIVFLLAVLSVFLLKTHPLHLCVVSVPPHLLKGMDPAIVPSLLCVISFFSLLGYSHKYTSILLFSHLQKKRINERKERKEKKESTIFCVSLLNKTVWKSFYIYVFHFLPSHFFSNFLHSDYSTLPILWKRFY